MLLAEKLFLLLIDDEKQKIPWIYVSGGNNVGAGLAGAHLIDLFFEKKIEFLQNTKKLRVIDESPTGDDILDFILDLIKKYEKEKRLFNILRTLLGKKGREGRGFYYSKKPKFIINSIMDRLIKKGIISWEGNQQKMLKPEIKKEILEEIHSIALENKDPDEKMVYFLTIIYAMRDIALRRMFTRQVRDKAKARIKLLTKSNKSMKLAIYKAREPMYR